MKNTTFRRFALLLLALLMLISAAACQNDPADVESGTTGSTEDETEAVDLIEALPTIKYNYEPFTFLVRDGTKYFSDVIVEEFFEASPEIDKAIYERNEAIMERYEVDFVYKKVAQDNPFNSEVVTASNTGSDVYDVVVGHGRNLFNGIISGLYTDWNNMEYVNLEADWWNQSARQMLATPGGKLFAMNGDLSYLSIGSIRAMFFNKQTIHDAGLESPYDLVENNEWTLENFMTMVMEVGATLPENTSNSIQTGSFAYATNRWRGPLSILYSAGAQGLALQEDGTYVIGLTDERVGTAFSTYRAFILEFDTVFWGPNDSDLQPIRDAFIAGAVCFSDDDIYQAAVYKGTEVDYGIVPWPKYEEIDQFPSIIDSGTNTFGVLKNTSKENLSRVSLILEAMAVYGHVDVLPYYYETILCLQGSRDERTRDMLELVHDTATVDFAQYTNFGGIGNVSVYVMQNPSTYGTTLSTGVAVVRNAVMQKLEEWYALDALTD